MGAAGRRLLHPKRPRLRIGTQLYNPAVFDVEPFSATVPGSS